MGLRKKRIKSPLFFVYCPSAEKTVKEAIMDLITSLVSLYLSDRRKAIAKYATSAREMQEKVLRSLVRRAAKTEWGREHKYSEIKNYDDFAANVPITSYDDLQESIERMRHGAKDVLWPGLVRYYAKSSGTTAGRSKYIPVTKVGLRRLHTMGGHDVTAMYLGRNKKSRLTTGHSLILTGGFDPELDTPTSRTGYVSSIMTSTLPQFLRRIMKFGPPVEIASIKDFGERREKLAEYALKTKVTSISGVPSWWLSVLSRTMEMAGKETMDEIWPDLEIFVHGGVAFTQYRDLYHKIITKPDMHYVETYNASEGFFGVQTDPADPAMTLMVDYDVFYEFIPLSELGNKDAKAVPVWEVEPGVNYAMVISTSCGLWRYLLGDTIRFTRKNPYRFMITGRTRQFINAYGEEVILENAEKGLEAACKATGAKVLEYHAAPVYMDEHGKARHQWMVEFAEEPDSMEKFVAELDNGIRACNSDYDDKRYEDIVLSRIDLVKARKGLFHDWMAKHGKLGGQNKVPRLANSRDIMDELLGMN